MAFSFRSTYDAELEERVKAFCETLSEKDRRRYVAVEARRLGHGGITYVAGGIPKPAVDDRWSQVRQTTSFIHGTRI